MKINYLENKELEKALKEYLDIIRELVVFSREKISIKDALNRFTAAPVYAAVSSPDYYASAMDGAALKSSKTYGASESNPIELKEGSDYFIVDTGDPVPDGCDAVLMIEDLVRIDDNTIRIFKSVFPFENIRQIGEDICCGEMIVPSYTLLTPSAVGALISGGISEIEVIKRPVVSIIPTGDEIVSPEDKVLTKGKIREFNSNVFSGYLNNWGAVSCVYPVIPDNFELLEKAVSDAVSKSDIILVNAGSSAGRDDYTASVISKLGTVITHGISIKPGKPVILGKIAGKPVIGIPGYPVSGIIIMREIVRSVVELWGRVYTEDGGVVSAKLSGRIVSSLKYKEFVRVRVGVVNNEVIAVPLRSGAGVISSYLKADGILEIDKNAEGVEGSTIQRIELLRPYSDIENTILINGSHDPMLDEIDDIIRIKGGGRLSSSHTGSMGGIYAVKKGESHIAGVHLIDTVSGIYNKTYFDKFLSPDDFVLVKGFKRIQGVIAAKGNPLNIKGIDDLALGNLRFVNRQRGSGTRILFDYLLSLKGIKSSTINGYQREEFTHLASAVQIASGGADACMGIFAAAEIYDLDFIPICEEEYDFIVRKDFMDSDKWLLFEAVLKSDEFKKRVTQAGGYII